MAVGDNMPTFASSTYSTKAFDSEASACGKLFMPFKGMADDRRFKSIDPISREQMLNMLETNIMPRRVVKVLVADTNENVPLTDCLLYSGEEKLTDLTDQELYFEIDINTLLAKHNEKRVKIVDKKVKDRTEYLEPAKVRDLKMVVVTVAAL